MSPPALERPGHGVAEDLVSEAFTKVLVVILHGAGPQHAFRPYLVATIRNLGHPPRWLRHVQSASPFVPGAEVLAGGDVVGEVTSAAPLPDACVGFVRVVWDAAATQLTDMQGRPLQDVPATG